LSQLTGALVPTLEKLTLAQAHLAAGLIAEFVDVQSSSQVSITLPLICFHVSSCLAQKISSTLLTSSQIRMS
jgi:hypothetical protein